MIIKYIIISIIGSITNLLPISYQTHIYIYQNLFNTSIFNNNILINSIYISLPLSIIFIYNQDIFKYLTLPIKKVLKHHKTNNVPNLLPFIIVTTLSTIIISFIPKLPLTIKNVPIYLFILSIIIYISHNKYNNKNNLSIKDSLLISISHIINIIPTISPLCSNLLISKIIKLNKKLTIKLSLLSLIPLYIIKSIPTINYLINNLNYLPYYLLTIIISLIINIKTINYLKDLYYTNKLYKLSIYIIILGIFIIYWYR